MIYFYLTVGIYGFGFIHTGNGHRLMFQTMLGQLAATVTRNYLLTLAWSLFCKRIKPSVVEQLVTMPAVNVSHDKWIIAGEYSRLKLLECVLRTQH